jgi:hypothetical protein
MGAYRFRSSPPTRAERGLARGWPWSSTRRSAHRSPPAPGRVGPHGGIGSARQRSVWRRLVPRQRRDNERLVIRGDGRVSVRVSEVRKPWSDGVSGLRGNRRRPPRGSSGPCVLMDMGVQVPPRPRRRGRRSVGPTPTPRPLERPRSPAGAFVFAGSTRADRFEASVGLGAACREVGQPASAVRSSRWRAPSSVRSRLNSSATHRCII